MRTAAVLAFDDGTTTRLVYEVDRNAGALPRAARVVDRDGAWLDRVRDWLRNRSELVGFGRWRMRDYEVPLPVWLEWRRESERASFCVVRVTDEDGPPSACIPIQPEIGRQDGRFVAPSPTGRTGHSRMSPVQPSNTIRPLDGSSREDEGAATCFAGRTWHSLGRDA